MILQRPLEEQNTISLCFQLALSCEKKNISLDQKFNLQHKINEYLYLCLTIQSLNSVILKTMSFFKECDSDFIDIIKIILEEIKGNSFLQEDNTFFIIINRLFCLPNIFIIKPQILY
ncbi:hypothetical protein pb186bvf_020956 [Paramecium bursaria]